MNPVFVIFNPTAGRYHAARRKSRLIHTLSAARIPFELEQTLHPGHARQLAQQGAETGHKIIVAVGGDGTVNEIVNGMLEADTSTKEKSSLAIVPMGSGNDFAVNVGPPLALNRVAQAILRGKTRSVDIGYVQWNHNQISTKRFFANNLGIGFEAEINIKSKKIKWIRGMPLYFCAALWAMHKTIYSQIDMSWKDDEGKLHSVSQPLLMISIANGSRTGGGFRLIPSAIIDDGVLDLGTISPINRFQFLSLLLKVIRGTHIDEPRVTFSRCKKLTITCGKPLPVHTDGDVITEHASEVHVTLHDKRLQVII
ncbi:MAG: YegS/Rv2252/BmrU family lipid kinase [Kiritimatiellae bacterium]|nr:YegS/Rv2252/BmrU family lipid kinase [Kiritimatiellia bacterium]